ncbi:DUF2515 family protein [Paenibacillus lutrae]|uniref:DUF2515 domain-containing protein n=1 Tax=Paenibacillus lutrae TaxID=2078573 RepID=A0A7X3FLM4_9BACL|nr:DUF2515 family protein [Paenibacillus lutrae]MVP01744.1 DUF2515 domain-containing protein [Paenibacillus lutrae]
MNHAKENSIWRTIGSWIRSLPKTLAQLILAKRTSMQSARKLQAAATRKLVPDQATIRRLQHTCTALIPESFTSPSLSESLSFTSEENSLIEQIRLATGRGNRNNVTRTQAYWEMYTKHPELHWALLAHMVSRNGGWSMTDLHGQYLPFLLSPSQRQTIFSFLEKANCLIFGDAYPQLLLYQATLTSKQSLFHLLPAFGVSAFMKPVWEEFWRAQDSVMLTTALIINEQHYIEGRVVKAPYYAEHVLGSLKFQMQALMQLNQIVFPFAKKSGDKVLQDPPIHLAGAILEDFSDLRERIQFGKTLYGILFGIPAVYEGVLRFAAYPHTGSRADYWPHLFTNAQEEPPSITTHLNKIAGCELMPGASQVYSPRLTDAWDDVPLAPVEPGDWFHTADVLGFIGDIAIPDLFEMSAESCFGLHKVQTAALAAQQLKG